MKWELTVAKDRVNGYPINLVYRRCPVCHGNFAEIFAAFFTTKDDKEAEKAALECALKSNKLTNFCSNCGADLRETKEGVSV